MHWLIAFYFYKKYKPIREQKNHISSKFLDAKYSFTTKYLNKVSYSNGHFKSIGYFYIVLFSTFLIQFNNLQRHSALQQLCMWFFAKYIVYDI